MVIAIDGPAGSGKSTVSSMVATRLGLFYLNSGRFYRAITRKALQQGKFPNNDQAVVAIAADINIDVERNRFLVDGKNVNKELHTPEVDANVAAVSAIPDVRIAVNARIKRIASEKNVVAEGRDMTTVVFPNAELKIFLDASAEARARRRHQELNEQMSYEQVLQTIKQRDEIDTSKEVGRLQRPPDAVYLDTTDLTLEEVCEKVVATIQTKTNQIRSK